MLSKHYLNERMGERMDVARLVPHGLRLRGFKALNNSSRRPDTQQVSHVCLCALPLPKQMYTVSSQRQGRPTKTLLVSFEACDSLEEISILSVLHTE